MVSWPVFAATGMRNEDDPPDFKGSSRGHVAEVDDSPQVDGVITVTLAP
jgi:hypothetical protein